MARFIIDVSRRWGPDDFIPATLTLEAEGDSQSETGMTARGALARFRRAAGQWLANTEAGRRSWEGSSKDFNYGDFMQDDVADDPDFRRFLEANGLKSAKVERLDVAEDAGETYDSVIAPEGG